MGKEVCDAGMYQPAIGPGGRYNTREKNCFLYCPLGDTGILKQSVYTARVWDTGKQNTLNEP